MIADRPRRLSGGDAGTNGGEFSVPAAGESENDDEGDDDDDDAVDADGNVDDGDDAEGTDDSMASQAFSLDGRSMRNLEMSSGFPP